MNKFNMFITAVCVLFLIRSWIFPARNHNEIMLNIENKGSLILGFRSYVFAFGRGVSVQFLYNRRACDPGDRDQVVKVSS